MTRADLMTDRFVGPQSGPPKVSRHGDGAEGAASDNGDFHRMMSKVAAAKGKEREPQSKGGDARTEARSPTAKNARDGVGKARDAVTRESGGADSADKADKADDAQASDEGDAAAALLQLMEGTGTQTSPTPAAGGNAQAMAGAVAMMLAQGAETEAAGQAGGADGAGNTTPTPEDSAALAAAKLDQLRELAAGSLSAKVTVAGRETHVFAGRTPPMAEQNAEGETAGETVPGAQLPGAAAAGVRDPRAAAAGNAGRRGEGGAQDKSGGSADGRAALPDPNASVQAGIGVTAGDVQARAQPALAPVRQIADQIINAAAAGSTSAAAADKPATSSGIVKVLTIHLQPPELGTVAVRMALNDGNIELQLEVGRADTARLLQRDRDRMSDILRGAGYNVDAVSVRVVERGGVSATSQTGNEGLGSSTQSQTGPSPQDGGGQERRGQSGSGGGFDRNQGARIGGDEEHRNHGRAGSGLYV